MKKLALTTICALAITGAAFAQGTVNWSAITPAAFTIQTNATAFSPLFGGGTTGSGTVGLTGTATLGFYYEVLYNTSFTGSQVSGANAPSNSFAVLFGGSWLDSGLGATNAVSSTGKAGPNPSTGNTAQTVPWAAGTTDNIVIVGWSANLGNNWNTVSNELATGSYAGVLGAQEGFFGVSATGFSTVGSGNPGAVIVGTSAGAQGRPISSLNTQLFLLPPVPEPSTMALAGLGGLAVLLFRRRK